MSEGYDPLVRPTTRRPWLPAAVWLALTVAALGFVGTFGHDLPWADEWEFVPAVVGDEPLGQWLWRQHNEHRLPLPRLAWLVATRTAGDFRGGMVVQVLILSGTALLMMAAAVRLRGGLHWADVFFPLTLLHWGHAENLLMGYQLCFVLVSAATAGLAVTATVATPANRFRTGLWVIAFTAVLTLCGAGGLMVALPACGWLVYLGVAEARAGNPGRGTLLIAAVVAVAGYFWLYFTDYRRPDHHPSPALGFHSVAVFAEVIAVGCGIAVEWIWPAAAVATLVCIGLATQRFAVLLRIPKGRPMAVGGLAVLAGVLLVAAAVGLSRGPMGFDMGLWPRYAVLSWPAVAVVYLGWSNAPGLQAYLAWFAAILLPFNCAAGVRWAQGYDTLNSALTSDARNGLPAATVAKHVEFQGQAERAERGLPLLQAAGLGPYRR
jgi:hypothetical protein